VDLEELSYCGFSPSALITKHHSGDHIANNRKDEEIVMDMRQETVYVILVGKCEGKRHVGRSRYG
jgi:hypothetical protein